MFSNTFSKMIKMAASAQPASQEPIVQEMPGQSPVETTPPVEEEQATVVTCLSDCVYANNPEKTCMLKSISLSMNPKEGNFICGQYTQAAPAPAPMQGLAGRQPLQ